MNTGPGYYGSSGGQLYPGGPYTMGANTGGGTYGGGGGAVGAGGPYTMGASSSPADPLAQSSILDPSQQIAQGEGQGAYYGGGIPNQGQPDLGGYAQYVQGQIRNDMVGPGGPNTYADPYQYSSQGFVGPPYDPNANQGIPGFNVPPDVSGQQAMAIDQRAQQMAGGYNQPYGQINPMSYGMLNTMDRPAAGGMFGGGSNFGGGGTPYGSFGGGGMRSGGFGGAPGGGYGARGGYGGRGGYGHPSSSYGGPSVSQNQSFGRQGTAVNPLLYQSFSQLLGDQTKNYSNMLGLYGQAQGNVQGQVPGIAQGYGTLAGNVENTLGLGGALGGNNWGVAGPAAAAIGRSFEEAQGRTNQQMINSGLSNTTAVGNMQNQNAYLASQAYAGLGANLAQTAAGYQANLGQAGLGAQMQGLGMQNQLASAQLGGLANYRFANTMGDLQSRYGMEQSVGASGHAPTWAIGAYSGYGRGGYGGGGGYSGLNNYMTI